jgi:hypothetical protein
MASFITGDFISGVESSGSVPAQFGLSQNYPNPFNPTTAISYQLPAPSARQTAGGLGAEGSAISFVTLRVYDLLGRVVATLVNDERDAGTHTVIWDASSHPSGVYFYCLRAGSSVQTKKMIVSK